MTSSALHVQSMDRKRVSTLTGQLSQFNVVLRLVKHPYCMVGQPSLQCLTADEPGNELGYVVAIADDDVSLVGRRIAMPKCFSICSLLISHTYCRLTLAAGPHFACLCNSRNKTHSMALCTYIKRFQTRHDIQTSQQTFLLLPNAKSSHTFRCKAAYQILTRPFLETPGNAHKNPLSICS